MRTVQTPKATNLRDLDLLGSDDNGTESSSRINNNTHNNHVDFLLGAKRLSYCFVFEPMLYKQQ